MNTRLLTIVCAAATLSLSASTGYGQVLVCSLGGPGAGYNPTFDSDPPAFAMNVAKRVADALCDGRCGVTLSQNPTAPNAMTFVVPSGQAKIVYSPAFMNEVEARIGGAATFGILAHEVGHVVDGRTQVSWMLDSWSRELRADAWAGCALARAGLSTSELQTALMAVSQYPSATHPAWNLRLPAVATGYSACGGQQKLPTP
jgi:hypothetical protein